MVAGLVTDPELVARNAALVKQIEQLETLAKDRAALAEQTIGVVSHDIRNRLATINMAADMLGEVDPSAVVRLGQQIKRASRRANHLISDLLDFTQARIAGGLFVTLGEANLHEVVIDALDALRVAHPGQRFEHVRLGKGIATLDASRFEQLIGKLAANAVAYGAADQPITLTSTIEDDTVSVAVHNLGAPIAEEARPTLFDAMVRSAELRGKTGGVGLGLFLVREIAKAHGGRVFVESTAAAGTTFTVEAPRHSPS